MKRFLKKLYFQYKQENAYGMSLIRFNAFGYLVQIWLPTVRFIKWIR